MKRIISICSVLGLTSILILGIVILIPCLLLFGFFESDNPDDYVENNIIYAEEYKSVLNENITKNNNGYVPLNRILYFYKSNENKSFSEIYLKNLDSDTKRMKPISDVCIENNFLGCNNLEIKNGNQIDEFQKKPFSKPIDFSKATITSFFMQERIVYDQFDVHKAWDFASNAEEEVYSVCDGIAKRVSFPYSENKIDTNGGYGNYIELECLIENKKYKVIYGHLFPKSTTIKNGDKVSKNQKIATVGTTGYSTGNHLHFQVQNEKNEYIDGMSFINFLEDKSIKEELKDDYLLPPKLKKN